MVQFNCLDFSAVPNKSAEARRTLLQKRLIKNLSKELVTSTIKSLVRGELEKWVVSYPKHGILFTFFNDEEKLPYHPCSGVVKWFDRLLA